MTFREFLCGMPAEDYIFQETPYEEQIQKAARIIEDADDILIGGGAGLSAAAGLTYGGKRFSDNFPEFIKKYGMTDMYSAGFYPFPDEESRWGYWSKHVYVNRIEPEALPLYKTLYEMVKGKSYFVLTTNADHQFYKAGFEDERIFATQGDYGYIQCLHGCHNRVYDNTKMVTLMHRARKDCVIPSSLVPKCPVCGGPMTMNLRCDQYFVEDSAWHKAENNFGIFLSRCVNEKTVLLELGAGFNTPAIIRFPFERLAAKKKNMTLIRLNRDEAIVPRSPGERVIGINADMEKSIKDLAAEINGKVQKS